MNSKLIPMMLIIIGGTMVYAGIKGQSPIAILKSVLTDTAIPEAPTDTTAPQQTTPTPENPTGIVPQSGIGVN